MIRVEQLQLKALAYDTTNFYTYVASTNTRKSAATLASTASAKQVWVLRDGRVVRGSTQR